MNITIEIVNERKRVLEKELDDTLSKANALSGGIQDCEYWISKILEIEKKDDKDSPE